METCTLCNGQGLIGSGPNPHLQEGQKKTCPNCSGTGKVGAVETAEPAPAEEVIPAEAEEATAGHVETQTADVEEKKDEQPIPADDQTVTLDPVVAPSTLQE